MAQTSREPTSSFARGEGEGRIAFRVSIGVTGHRRLPNEEAVALRVGEQLARVREWFSNTEFTSTRFTILSALAEGADRIVARVAPMALAGTTVDLQAILPLVVPDYLQDFATEASQCDFEELLARSPAPIELADHWALTPEERIDAYEQAGCYIVDHSDVLIAVWDGRDSRGRGGTRAVIEYAHDQGVPVLLVPAEEAEPGPGHFDWAVFKPLSAPAPLLEAFRRINEYNRSSLRQVRLSEMLEASYGELDEVLAKLSIRYTCRPVLNWAVPHFVRADALAVQYQFRYRMLGRAIYFLAAFAVTAVAAQTVFAPTTTAWLGFEIGMLLLLIVALWIGRRGQVHERWMGYRSLAEAFRSALFLSVSHAAEVSEDQDEGARIRAPWFQRAFSEAWPQRPEVSLREGEAGDLREFLLAAWINDQIGFHRSTARRSEGRRQLYTWIVYALAGVTITVAALHIAHVPSGEGWARAFEFLAIMLPGFGAAVTGLREHGQHRLHEERSKRTAERLELLRRQPDPDGDLDDVRKLANATQRVIVEENLNWSGVVEFQDLELVI